MAVGPLAHGYLAFKLNALQTLVAEEETHDEKPQGKGKAEIKPQYLSYIQFHTCASLEQLKQSHHFLQVMLSKGYAGTPYMPPELV